MRTRYSSSFALGYLAVGIVQFFRDMIVGVFEIAFWLVKQIFGVAVKGADHGRRDSFDQALQIAVAPYLPVLAQKRAKLYRADDYEVLRPEKWAKELNYFIHEVLIPQTAVDGGYVERNLRDVANRLDDLIADYHPQAVAFGHRA